MRSTPNVRSVVTATHGGWEPVFLWWADIRQRLSKQAGRSAVIGVGVLLMAAGSLFGFLGRGDAIAVSMLVGGVLLFALGALLPHIKRIKSPGFEVETRERPLQLAREVEQVRERRLDPESIDLVGDDAWDGARYRLGERAVECLLPNLGGNLFACEARIFLFDAVEQQLMPVFRPEHAVGEPLGWAPGEGVTGVAFEENRYVYATGEHTHDETYGLSPEKQRRYSDLTAVAAVPLTDREGNVLGTLSLSTRAPGTNLTTDAGYAEHVALAQQISVALVDLLRVTA